MRTSHLVSLACLSLATLAAGATACGGSDSSGFPAQTDGGTVVVPDSSVTSDTGSFEVPDGGFTTTDTGTTVVDGGTAACATGSTGARRIPGYVQLVLDGSGSMSNQNRWVAVRNAVSALVTKWQTANDPTFGVGVSGFSDASDPNTIHTGNILNPDDGALRPGAVYPSNIDVPIRRVDATQGSAIVGRTSPDPYGLTHSYTALSGNYAYLNTFNAGAAGLPVGGKKVLVFMSDGGPTDACAADPSLCFNAARAFKARGITTYTILFASGTPDPSLKTFMGTIALQGGGYATPGCTAQNCQFQVDTISGNAAAISQAFQAAIDQALGSSLDPCTLAIEGTGFDPALVNVTISAGSGTKTNVLKDPVDGWSYDDPSAPTSVVLHGAACTQVKNDPAASVQLVLGCPSETPR